MIRISFVRIAFKVLWYWKSYNTDNYLLFSLFFYNAAQHPIMFYIISNILCTIRIWQIRLRGCTESDRLLGWEWMIFLGQKKSKDNHKMFALRFSESGALINISDNCIFRNWPSSLHLSYLRSSNGIWVMVQGTTDVKVAMPGTMASAQARTLPTITTTHKTQSPTGGPSNHSSYGMGVWVAKQSGPEGGYSNPLAPFWATCIPLCINYRQQRVIAHPGATPPPQKKEQRPVMEQ